MCTLLNNPTCLPLKDSDVAQEKRRLNSGEANDNLIQIKNLKKVSCSLSFSEHDSHHCYTLKVCLCELFVDLGFMHVPNSVWLTKVVVLFSLIHTFMHGSMIVSSYSHIELFYRNMLDI